MGINNGKKNAKTEVQKFRSVMAKLDNQMKADMAARKERKTHKGNKKYE